MLKEYGFLKSCGIVVGLFFTMFSIVACGSWWFVFLSIVILGPMEQLTYYIMLWGTISNLCLASVCCGWIVYLLIKIRQNTVRLKTLKNT